MLHQHTNLQEKRLKKQKSYLVKSDVVKVLYFHRIYVYVRFFAFSVNIYQMLEII